MRDLAKFVTRLTPNVYLAMTRKSDEFIKFPKVNLRDKEACV